MVQRLTEVRPATLGQALRIPGVTPAAVAVCRLLYRSFPRSAARLIASACGAAGLPHPPRARRVDKAGIVPAQTIWPRQPDSRTTSCSPRWNRKINLTALTDPDEAIDRLLLEPLVAARYLPVPGEPSLMDIGSGGGSPAIPLKLATPAPRPDDGRGQGAQVGVPARGHPAARARLDTMSRTPATRSC